MLISIPCTFPAFADAVINHTTTTKSYDLSTREETITFISDNGPIAKQVHIPFSAIPTPRYYLLKESAAEGGRG